MSQKMRVLCGVLGVVLGLAGLPPASAQQQFTEWGWPQPYEQISPKSVEYLKQRGWWPIQYAYQARWLGQSTLPLLIKSHGLDNKRGLDISLQQFLAGPPVNEAIVAGKIQMGFGGNFPLTTLILRKAPVRTPGIVLTPGLEHSIMVRPDSAIRKPADLRGKVVGLVAGSSAEFAFAAFLRGNGIDSKDVAIRPMPIPDQATMPQGIDAVVPWSPMPRLMAVYRKNAQLFDHTGSYQVFWGTLNLREEMFEHTPDVVQAIVDMNVEALLIARRDLKAAVAVTQKDPELDGLSAELLYDETLNTVAMLKPTWIYPFVDVYAIEGARVARFLRDSGRIKETVGEDAYRAWFQGGTKWMDTTFRKLGWKIPKVPPYFPPGMTVEAFRKGAESGERMNLIIPYKLQQPQAFPEPADLDRRWYFNGKWYEPGR